MPFVIDTKDEYNTLKNKVRATATGKLATTKKPEKPAPVEPLKVMQSPELTALAQAMLAAVRGQNEISKQITQAMNSKPKQWRFDITRNSDGEMKTVLAKAE